MKAQLEALKPVDIAAYLSARGWIRRASFREDKASLWISPKGGAMDVLLPLRPNLADFSLRMGELVMSLARYERRSAQDVLRDLAAVYADIIRVRIITGDSSATTLPFRDGLNLLKKVRDVLVAAALSTLEKRAFFTNRWPETIIEFMDRLQMGQTEHSSFVFTIVSPLGPPEEALDGAGEAQEPFARRVTHTLMHALQAMERAAADAAREGGVNPFLRAIDDGVSGNLCDAVVELKALCPENPIEFSVSWAAGFAPPAEAIGAVLLRQDSVPYIEAASDAFWGIPKKYDYALEGMVVGLDTPEDASSGVAMLMGYIDGKPARLRASFNADAYRDVVQAYRSRALICCEGDLVKEAGVLTLKNARYFRILSGADHDGALV
jgi:hypothetical protein